MKRLSIVTIILFAALMLFGGITVSAEQADQEGNIRMKSDEAGLVEMAKISMDNAINAALKEVPGKVLRAELENENGYLVYGVEIIKADQQIMVVKVDAGNGLILRTDKDKRDTEGRERERKDNDHERED